MTAMEVIAGFIVAMKLNSPDERIDQCYFFTKIFVHFSKMYKIFGCQIEDFPGFLGEIQVLEWNPADISENLKIFEVFYKNVQNFEKQ